MLKLTTKKLAVLSIMMALGVILKSFLSIGSENFRISFWNIPLFLAGIIGGPLYGGLCAFGADLIYGICFSSYPFSFIMSISCTIWGIAGGIFYKKDLKIIPLIIVVLATCLMETFINSLYLYIYYDSIQTVLVLLPQRLLVQLARCPISIILIYVLELEVLSHFNFNNKTVAKNKQK